MSYLFIIVSFLLMALAVDPSSETAKGQQDISHYLPKSSELKEWKPVGSPQKFEGEDLYLLINGGAVVYYEYICQKIICIIISCGDSRIHVICAKEKSISKIIDEWSIYTANEPNVILL